MQRRPSKQGSKSICRVSVESLIMLYNCELFLVLCLLAEDHTYAKGCLSKPGTFQYQVKNLYKNGHTSPYSSDVQIQKSRPSMQLPCYLAGVIKTL